MLFFKTKSSRAATYLCFIDTFWHCSSDGSFLGCRKTAEIGSKWVGKKRTPSAVCHGSPPQLPPPLQISAGETTMLVFGLGLGACSNAVFKAVSPSLEHLRCVYLDSHPLQLGEDGH